MNQVNLLVKGRKGSEFRHFPPKSLATALLVNFCKHSNTQSQQNFHVVVILQTLTRGYDSTMIYIDYSLNSSSSDTAKDNSNAIQISQQLQRRFRKCASQISIVLSHPSSQCHVHALFPQTLPNPRPLPCHVLALSSNCLIPKGHHVLSPQIATVHADVPALPPFQMMEFDETSNILWFFYTHYSIYRGIARLFRSEADYVCIYCNNGTIGSESVCRAGFCFSQMYEATRDSCGVASGPDRRVEKLTEHPCYPCSGISHPSLEWGDYQKFWLI